MMASKRHRSGSNDIQPRCDAIRPKTVSAPNDSEVEEVTNVEYKPELEQHNRPIIEKDLIYNRRLKEGEARILVLSPGSGSDEIKCELKIDESLPYDALSYQWGGQEDNKLILLQNVHFAVTKNLAEALRYLRCPRSERLLWVDAICINQYDKEEKEVQVQSMHLIYEKANKVIAWLGPPSDAINWAFDSMDMVPSELQVGVPVTVVIRGYGEEALDDETSDDDNPFGELMACTYWSRAWIVQEIMCAKSLFIQCGHRVQPYDRLENAFPPGQSASAEVIPANSEMGRTCYQGEDEVKIVRRGFQMLSSKQYLDYFLDRECGLRHDNIYAFLYLLRNDVKQRRPNYQCDIRELVFKTFLKIIESTQSLHIIIIKGRQKPPCNREEAWQLDMPSWCPYLATPYQCRPIEVKNGPNLFAEKAVSSIVEKRLQIRGFVIGRVARTISQRIPPKVRGSIGWDPADVERELNHYRKCLALGLKGVPKDNESRGTSMMATTRTLLVAGQGEDHHFLEPWKSSFRDLDEQDGMFLRKILKNRISRSVCSFRLDLAVKKALKASEAAPSTKINRIALVPHTAHEGDEICVILGCSTPVVLRKIGEQYLVLGEAYIDTTSMGKFKVSVRLRDFLLQGKIDLKDKEDKDES
ncbi:hypothetical protein yc1106_05403 [Curvularia clavata]|uniref:Heterokaryon incompatibility domain-containing protein n=1 Tax=Curvularia clavata TaxID=95742 RepID=A0A9Q9DTU0_CURCL|nr:hypothetical protein yc1106_05403 [Curvularia clavata]